MKTKRQMRLKKEKSKLVFCIIALAASFITFLSQPTLAYYTTSGIATNVITSGDISLRIIEKMGDKEFPKEGVYILPGSIVSKKVNFMNDGGHPFWLRVKLTNGIDDEALSADIFELDINTRDWTDGGDGYYYYNGILESGMTTPALFTQVKIAGSAGNEYLGKTANITVSAFAVQSEFNPASSAMEVTGWPEDAGGAK